MVATLERGAAGSISRTDCCSDAAIASGSPLARTTRNRAGDAINGVYTVPALGCEIPSYLASLTTPTTVVHGQVVQPPPFKRLPTALSFGKKRRAHARSTITDSSAC